MLRVLLLPVAAGDDVQKKSEKALETQTALGDLAACDWSR